MIGELFGRPVGQSWDDLGLWEKVLNEFDHLRWIVELGTWEGGMSFYLAAQCFARRMVFHTFDKNSPTEWVCNFQKRDVLNYLLPDKVMDLIHAHPGILFCDDGNKRKEVLFYHFRLHKRSFIAVHDWGIEFEQDDIPESHRALVSNETTVFLARNDFINQYFTEGGRAIW